ncbi:MAG: metallophosphoesterase [Methylococcaceae bacterium]|nr:metallophosphoesterase [Methylococcaceae bacterium]
MKIVAFSDTHMRHCEIVMPEGDLLIFAGDMCRFGELDEIKDFNQYLSSLPHPYKIVIAGNHDWPFESQSLAAQQLLTEAIYLQDNAVEIEGLKIYGSPWQPEFFSWAFNLPRGKLLREKWDLIPVDCDILITHSPPFLIRDQLKNGEHVGCEMLKTALETTIKPKVHIFGHIHEAYGLYETNETTYANACLCTEYAGALNSPLVIELN